MCKKLRTAPSDIWWLDAQMTGHTVLAGLFEVPPALLPAFKLLGKGEMGAACTWCQHCVSFAWS